MDYAKAVARVRSLSARSDADQWEQARLTHEHTTGENSVTLTRWASDCGFSETHANYLRKTWAMFGDPQGPEDRTNLTFAECYALAGKTPEKAERLRRRAARSGRSVTSEERVSRPRDRGRAAREALLDDDMRRELFKDPRIRAMFERELTRGRRRRVPPHRVVREVEDELVARIEAFHRQLLLLLRDMLDDPPTEEERREILRLVAEIRHALDWVRSFVKDGGRSFEDALEALLEDAAQADQAPPARERKPEPDAPAQEEPPTTKPTKERPGREGSHQPPTGTRRTRPRRRKVG